MPPNSAGPPERDRAAPHHQDDPNERLDDRTPDSRIVTDADDIRQGNSQVSWWSVHEFVDPVLRRIGTWPMIGTPAWCDLPADSRHKLAAVFDAAQHWALRLETCQQARHQASIDISADEGWVLLARRLRRGGS